MSHNLKPTTIHEACPNMQYRFKVQENDDGKIDLAEVSFSGKYRFGSSGIPDAGLMMGMIRTAMEIWVPKAIIIDLTDLEYEWGGNMKLVFEVSKEIPTAVVVSDKNKKALAGLMFGVETTKEITDNKFFFDSMEKAWQYLQK